MTHVFGKIKKLGEDQGGPAPLDKRIKFDTFMRMKAERPLNVVFFKTATGNEPVREWLKALSKEDSKTIGADILTLKYE